MTPVIPSSLCNVSLIPGSPFVTRKNECLKRCKFLRNSTDKKLPLKKYILPVSTSVRLFPQCRSGFALYHKSTIHRVSATGTDLTVEEVDSPATDENDSEISSEVVETSEESSGGSNASDRPSQSKRSRPARKSEMPPVKPEELVPGAMFTGKVRSIQPFGAFVDFGAFTDGLVHVSRLSDSFVKDVGNVVSVGQEVKVRLVEANMETGRISLTMRESDDISKLQQRKDAPGSSDKARPSRKGPRSNQKRDNVKKVSKFVKGQDLEGTVKNLTRSGSFITLPEGEEGFLPASEELDEGFGNIMGGSSLQVGQEVSVRVLQITRGQVTLTMKKEEAAGELDSKLRQGVVHAATNPFVLAFRKNKDIASFLDEKEKEAEPADSLETAPTTDQMEGKVSQTETELEEVQSQQASSSEGLLNDLSGVDEKVEDNQTSLKEVDGESSTAVDTSHEIPIDCKDSESKVSDSSEVINGLVQGKEEEMKVRTEILEESVSTTDQLTEEPPATVEDSQTSPKEVDVEASTAVDTSHEIPIDNKDSEIKVSDSSEVIDGLVQGKEEETKVRTEILTPEESVSTTDQLTEEPPATVEDSQISPKEVDVEASTAVDTSHEISIENKDSESKVSDSSEVIDGLVQGKEEETEVRTEILTPEESISTSDQLTAATNRVENERESDLPGEAEGQISPEDQVSEELTQISDNGSPEVKSDSLQSSDSATEIIEEKVEVRSELLPTEEEVSATEEIHTNDLENREKFNLSGQITDPITSERTTSKEVTESEADQSILEDEVQIPNIEAKNEILSDVIVEEDKVGSDPEKNGMVTNSNGQSGAPSPKESTTKATISPALVKQLREETGAGMMDCKKALSETGGDLIKAQEFLRKKGLASADKKASRVTAEGRIGSYIHDSRIGVLIEVNCETDFVSRGDIFKELVDDLAMQVAACPQVQYLVTDDVPKEMVDKEREIEMQKEDLLSKPEQIRSKIVDGRIRKRLEELALLEQPYIKNDKLVVKDWVKQTIATIGENIKVKRFLRYNLGEGLEKKSQDFAAEVAAQTAAKPTPSPAKEQPAAAEPQGAVDKPPKAAISAALVKELREETGAGMMDCKKALSETGGDLEKAQEYLRKKGLSTADKKSSRLVAEGRIGSYIHDSRIGVLIEVNCETDFVGRSEKFKELVDDLAMQVVACPQVQYVSIDNVPESIVSKEKELEMQREDLLSKPENIREKIVEGRISKRLGELVLLEQPFIKNDSLLVKDLVKQTVAALGENIKVRRFIRFTLGETTEIAKTEDEA